jgi:hypothetical protein
MNTYTRHAATKLTAVYAPNSYGLGDFLLQRCLLWDAIAKALDFKFYTNFANHPALATLLTGSDSSVVDLRSLVHHSRVPTLISDTHNRIPSEIYIRFSGKVVGNDRAALSSLIEDLNLPPFELLLGSSSTRLQQFFQPTRVVIDALHATLSANKLIPQSYLSLHIRAGDANMEHPRCAHHNLWSDTKFEQLDDFFAKHSHETVVLHCDSPSIKASLAKRYPVVNCNSHPALHFGATSARGFDVQAACATIVELFVMALSVNIESPLKKSNFTLLAEALRPLALTLIQPPENSKRRAITHPNATRPEPSQDLNSLEALCKHVATSLSSKTSIIPEELLEALSSQFNLSDASLTIGGTQTISALCNACSYRNRSLHALAAALFRKDQFCCALEVLSQCRGPATAGQLYLKGRIAVAQGDYHQAVTHFERCLTADPEHEAALKSLVSLAKKYPTNFSPDRYAGALSQLYEDRTLNASDLYPLTVYQPWQDLIRIGNRHDGGYLIMTALGHYDCFLSGGVGRNTSFEQHFCKLFDIPCLAFDHTVQKLPHPSDHITLVSKRIGNIEDDLNTNLSQYLGSHKDIFIKMDVEGAEYSWLESLEERHLINIKQLVIELHKPFSKRRLASIHKLTKTHTLVHVHANNAATITVIDGVQAPSTLEATFVRKNPLVTPQLNTRPLPHSMDSPNVPGRPEINLTHWPFVSGLKGVVHKVDANQEDESSTNKPTEDPPTELLDRYTMQGAIPMIKWFFDDTLTTSRTFTHNDYKNAAKSLSLGTFRYYGSLLPCLLKATEEHAIAGREVCVFGSRSVNCDAIALHRNARHVTILEYNVPHSEHPQVSCRRIDEALKVKDKWEVAFSISSFEHDGLGRYGDPLDPDGDLRAMREALQLLQNGGIMFLAVPTGRDCLVWNAHRIYGPKRLPLLLDGWETLGRFGFSRSLYQLPLGKYKQPVFVLRKPL